VVREMFERAMGFSDYVRHHQIARSEGTLLRYLTDAYRTLVKTVPEDTKSEELIDVTEWLGELVRQVDSSLLDEWEALAHPDDDAAVAAFAEDVLEHSPPPLTANRRAFSVLVRNAMFQRVELAARRQWEELGVLDGDDGWTTQRWFDAFQPFFDEYGEIVVDGDARNPALLTVIERDQEWQVRQVVLDPAGDLGWAVTATVDLRRSDEEGEVVLRIESVGELPAA